MKMTKHGWVIWIGLSMMAILLAVAIAFNLSPSSAMDKLVNPSLPEARVLGAVDKIFDVSLEGVEKNSFWGSGEQSFAGPQVLEIAAIDKADGMLNVEFGYVEAVDCNLHNPPPGFIPDSTWFSLVPRSEHENLFQYVVLKKLSVMLTLVGCPIEGYVWRSYGVAQVPFVRNKPVRIIAPKGVGARYQVL